MLTLVFTGDVRLYFGLDGPHPDTRQFDPRIIKALHESDYAVFNIEGPITATPPEKERGVILETSPAFLPVLERLHCNVLNLANNHAFDHGVPGLRDTIAAAGQRGWKWLGAGENLQEASAPLILTRDNDASVGLVSVCHPEGPVAGPSSPGVFSHTMPGLIRDRIRTLRRQCHFVGVVYHGGEEEHLFPIPSRRKRLLGYLHAGADFVIAHHAHVVQGFECTGEKSVFYGLGDFAFDFDFVTRNPAVNESVLLTLRFEIGRPPRCEPLFTVHDRRSGQIRVVEENRAFYSIPPGDYWNTYRRYAWDEMAERMVIVGNPKPHLLRRLRRAVGIAVDLKDPYQRPLIVAGAMEALRNIHGPRKTDRVSGSTLPIRHRRR